MRTRPNKKKYAHIVYVSLLNNSKSHNIMKIKHLTKQLFSAAHTKSFVNSMSNMNVIQRKKCSHLVQPDEIFSKSHNILNIKH